MKTKFSDLIDKESILLDRKRLTDFNKVRSFDSKVDRIMWDFLYENMQEIDRRDFLLIKGFAEEIKTKLGR